MNAPDLDEPILKHARGDFTPLHVDQTVGEALAQLRARPPAGRVIYFDVVDGENRLCGVVPTRRLLLNPLEAKLAEVMIRRLVTIPHSATVMHACELFTLHKLLALPVVDERGRLVGLVDVELYTDELADLAEEVDHDGLFQLIGVHAARARAGSPVNAFVQRFPWLLCNVFGGILAAFLSGAFQDVLDRLIVLALFIPVVLALSESVGIQSVSLAVQGPHGALRWRESLAAVRRELWTGLLLGVGSGVLVGLVAWLWKGELRVGLGLLMAIGISVTASAVAGVSVPLMLRLLRVEPRVAAGPIALVTADLATLTIYFNLARWWMA